MGFQRSPVLALTCRWMALGWMDSGLTFRGKLLIRKAARKVSSLRIWSSSASRALAPLSVRP
jgi:hypothetical protein